MGQAAEPSTTTALTVADLNTEVNHEPRILDVRLAEALGDGRPADIRPLVERHRKALEQFGEVFRTMRKTTAKGGRPGHDFWLNRKQAIWLCTKSETARATEISIEVIEVLRRPPRIPGRGAPDRREGPSPGRPPDARRSRDPRTVGA